MPDSIKRGASPEDGRDFTGAGLEKLALSAEELSYLLNRGYPLKTAAAFVGNHRLLSARQRAALARSVASESEIAARRGKLRAPESVAGERVLIDALNAVITLEVALSGSPVFLGMDGVYRDLAGLRGTYRIIDKTDGAVRLIISALKRLSVEKALFYLDAPVSNSGRLKAKIAEIAEEMGFPAEAELAENADAELFGLENVVSADSVVLDRCESWLNLGELIIPEIPGAWVIRELSIARGG